MITELIIQYYNLLQVIANFYTKLNVKYFSINTESSERSRQDIQKPVI